MERVHQALHVDTAPFAQALQAVDRLQEAYAQVARDFSRGFDSLRGEKNGLKTAQDIALSNGWYIGSPIDDLRGAVEFARLGMAGSIDEILQLIEEETRNNVDNVERRLVSTYENRAWVINQAFDAHRDKKYGLSIPAMLAQADGIHYDILGQHLFTNNKAKHIKSQLPGDPENNPAFNLDALFRLYLRPLEIEKDKSDLRRNTRMESGQYVQSSMNRHGVLHGNDLAYGTEINGLKAIALLDFLQWADVTLLGNDD